MYFKCSISLDYYILLLFVLQILLQYKHKLNEIVICIHIQLALALLYWHMFYRYEQSTQPRYHCILMLHLSTVI